MRTIQEIVAAASRLDAEHFLQLREALDRIEEALWKQELSRTSAELDEANVTDEQIDELVLKRRRESRT